MADEVLGRETSGLFNAGLTPCSHTTTTRRIIHSSFLGIIIIVLVVFLYVVVVLFVLLVLFFILFVLNTLPGVSTQTNLLVVVVCEHGVSPALKVLVPLPKIALVFLLPRSSVAFVSSSLPTSYSFIFSFVTSQTFRTRGIKKVRNNLHLGTELIYT